MGVRQAVCGAARVAVVVPLAVGFAAPVAAQRSTATLTATATVVADPLTIRTTAPLRVALAGVAAPELGVDSGRATWQLRAAPGTSVIVTFTLPSSLRGGRSGVTPIVDARRSSARWGTGDGATRRFAPGAGTLATFGDAGELGLGLDVVAAPTPTAPPDVYQGTLRLELTYL